MRRRIRRLVRAIRLLGLVGVGVALGCGPSYVLDWNHDPPATTRDFLAWEDHGMRVAPNGQPVTQAAEYAEVERVLALWDKVPGFPRSPRAILADASVFLMWREEPFPCSYAWRVELSAPNGDAACARAWTKAQDPASGTTCDANNAPCTIRVTHCNGLLDGDHMLVGYVSPMSKSALGYEVGNVLLIQTGKLRGPSGENTHAVYHKEYGVP